MLFSFLIFGLLLLYMVICILSIQLALFVSDRIVNRNLNFLVYMVIAMTGVLSPIALAVGYIIDQRLVK